MNYLEAKALLSEPARENARNIRLLMSGTAGLLPDFLKAHARRQGVELTITASEFGTLASEIHAPITGGFERVIVLMPWDLVPELDWRSGIPAAEPSKTDLLTEVETALLPKINALNATIFYVPAPTPPIFRNQNSQAALVAALEVLMSNAGATFIDCDGFSLSSYFTFGAPFGGRQVSAVAEKIADKLNAGAAERFKVLITDLDNTLWSGLIIEDGREALQWRPEGKGFRHFVYQTFLASLKSAGIVLVAVSRNDPEPVLEHLAAGEMTLKLDDFVHVAASYGAKSAHIKQIADALNLGTDSFVFVDDNPVELEEVKAMLPTVSVEQFPSNDDEMPAFLERLSRYFQRTSFTNEDKKRTELYRQRLEASTLEAKAGGDISAFLKGMKMRMIVREPAIDQRARAVQLINKTNQFNIDGIRHSNEEIHASVDNGGRLFTVELSDRTGSHGEVLVCLLRADLSVQAFVMSCRVFQRRLEFAFIAWLLDQVGGPIRFRPVETKRNEPLYRFLTEAALERDGSDYIASLPHFKDQHVQDCALFELETA